MIVFVFVVERKEDRMEIVGPLKILHLVKTYAMQLNQRSESMLCVLKKKSNREVMRTELKS